LRESRIVISRWEFESSVIGIVLSCLSVLGR